MYLGSHNLSPSAWGQYTNSKKHYNIRNWELGVWISGMNLLDLIPINSNRDGFESLGRTLGNGDSSKNPKSEVIQWQKLVLYEVPLSPNLNPWITEGNLPKKKVENS